MPHPAAREPLQQRVASVILEAAARVLARRAGASMVEVAAEAGVARATVYRYFPARQALLDELVQDARDRAAAALDDARVAEVDPHLAVDRVVRTLLELGPAFVVLMRERAAGAGTDAGADADVAGRVREAIRRGQGAGWIRRDVPDAWLTETLLGLVLSVQTAGGTLGRDDTVAAVSSLFLHGARAASPDDPGARPAPGPSPSTHTRA